MATSWQRWNAPRRRLPRAIIPARVYMLIGDLGRLMQARRNRALIRLTARPFKQDRGAVHN